MKRLIFCLCASLCFFACPVEDEEEYNNSPVVKPPAQTGNADLNVQYVRVNYLPENYSPDIATIISSKNELEQYLNLSQGEHGNMALDDAVKKYSNDYFANNFLVIVGFEVGSGSISHKVERIDENGSIVISRFSPEILTMDMAKWNIIIELSNDVKVETFNVEFVASPAKPIGSIDFNEQYMRWYFPFAMPSEDIAVIFSKKELEQYYEEAWKFLSLEEPVGYWYVTDFLNTIEEKYTDDYFANNYLVIVGLVEMSGSIRHKVESVGANGEIAIKRIVPEVGTDDIGSWNIIIELSNDVKIGKFKCVSLF